MAYRARSIGVSALTQPDQETQDNPIDGSGTERARCVLAPNPSPMTLDGTNTWLIAEPGSAAAIVIDPGPEDEGHLLRVRDLAASAGQRVALIVLTHRHSDHSAGAARFAELTGAPVRAVDPEQRLGDEGLAAGDALTVAGCELRVLATPGHSSDSVCLVLPADGAVLTGDTVLGRGTTVIGGDGSLTEYMGSLRRLRALADETDLRVLLPGHGPLLARRDPGLLPGPPDRAAGRGPGRAGGWRHDSGPDRGAGLRRRPEERVGRRASVGARPARLPEVPGPGAAGRDLVAA
jgi:glyoxylase-like metal-dependent hydrolase (beta-lactamase superfamily II)